MNVHIVSMMRSGHNAISHWLGEHFKAAGQTVKRIGPMNKDMQRSHTATTDVTIFTWPEWPVTAPAVAGSDVMFVVVRDAFNLFASRLELESNLAVPTSNFAGPSGHEAELARWKEHHVFAEAHPGQAILFNRWHTDPAYREAIITKRFRLAFTDAGIDKVPDAGGGSSFDGKNFDGNARNMPVNDRWRAYQNDPEWKRLASQIDADIELRGKYAGLADMPRIKPP